MNLDRHCFQVRKLSEDQKKRSLPKIQDFFSPNLSEDKKKQRSLPKIQECFSRTLVKTKKRSKHHLALRCRVESNYWEECRWKQWSNYLGGMQSNYWGIYPPIPPSGFGTPGYRYIAINVTYLLQKLAKFFSRGAFFLIPVNFRKWPRFGRNYRCTCVPGLRFLHFENRFVQVPNPVLLGGVTAW